MARGSILWRCQYHSECVHARGAPSHRTSTLSYRVAATVHVAGNGGPRPVAITENISRGGLGVLVYEARWDEL